METKKKLDLVRIGEHLQYVYQKELVGFKMVGQPELKRIGLLGKQDEMHTFAVVASFVHEQNPELKRYLLYYPLANETALEKELIVSSPYLKHDRVYIGDAYVRFFFDAKLDDFCLELRQFPPEISKTEDEARLRVNAMLLFSSNQMWEREAFVPQKSLQPYFDGRNCGYFYEFQNKKCSVVVTKSMECCLNPKELIFLKEPKLFELPQGNVIYFTGTRFVERYSAFLDKNEVRGMFRVIQKHYPNIKFYGHLIPIYEGECILENAAWVVGQVNDKFIVVNLLTKDIHERSNRFELAAPDDKNFFSA